MAQNGNTTGAPRRRPSVRRREWTVRTHRNPNKDKKIQPATQTQDHNSKTFKDPH